MNIKHFNLITLLSIPGIGRKKILNIEESLIKENDINELINNCTDVNSSGNFFSTLIEMHNINKDVIYKAQVLAQRVFEFCFSEGIKIISYLDSDYPEFLKSNTDKPVILFVKGNTDFLYDIASNYAVIGTRKATDDSKKFAYSLGEQIAQNGCRVVSGLAVGCDTYGHLGCLEQKGSTIAFMPCPLNRIYPSSNINLAKRIVENNGSLVSEYLPYSSTEKWNFIERDRLQALFSNGLFVVETSGNDGTMHTVKFALKYKKDIYCYKPQDDKLNNPNFKGNKILVQKNQAIFIDDFKNVVKLISN